MFPAIHERESGQLPWRSFYPHFKENWSVKNNHLMLGSRTVESLVKEHGTPVYLYDSEIALGRLRLLLETFSPFEISYFIKANPNPDLSVILAKYASQVSVQSLGEYNKTSLFPFPCGFNYCGPASRFNEYNKVLSDGRISNVDVESANQLQILEQACKIVDTWQLATVRINTRYTPRGATEHMAGGPIQFGIDEEKVIEELKDMPLERVRLHGIHVHSASGVLDPDELVNQFEYTAKCAIKISRALKFPLKVINFGGGIGIPYSSQKQHMDFFDLGKRVFDVLTDIFPDEKTRPRFQIEPGKFLVGECGVFVSKILDIEQRRIQGGNIPTILIDGNASFSRPAMSWAQPHPVSIATKQGEKPTGKYFIAGRHGGEEETDGIFPLQFGELPNPQVGELLVFHNAGAYGATMSFPMSTDSGRPPLEITYVNGKCKVHEF